MFENAAIIGVGQSAYTRRPEPGQTVLHFMRDAVVAALKDAGLTATDVQGMAVASFSLAPDAAGIVPQPVTLVGLGSLVQVLPLVRGRVAALHVELEFLGKQIDHATEAVGVAVVTE